MAGRDASGSVPTIGESRSIDTGKCLGWRALSEDCVMRIQLEVVIIQRQHISMVISSDAVTVDEVFDWDHEPTKIERVLW